MWQRLNFLGRRTVTAVIANRHLSFARGVWKLARLRLAAVGEVTHQAFGAGLGPRRGEAALQNCYDRHDRYDRPRACLGHGGHSGHSNGGGRL